MNSRTAAEWRLICARAGLLREVPDAALFRMHIPGRDRVDLGVQPAPRFDVHVHAWRRRSCRACLPIAAANFSFAAASRSLEAVFAAIVSAHFSRAAIAPR